MRLVVVGAGALILVALVIFWPDGGQEVARVQIVSDGGNSGPDESILARPARPPASASGQWASDAPAPDEAQTPTLDVLVFSYETGAPVAGARVGISPPYAEKLEYLSTDVDGEARFDVQPGGPYLVTVKADGLQSGRRVVEAGPGALHEQVRFDLFTLATVRGRVVEDNGAPVERAMLQMWRLDGIETGTGQAVPRRSMMTTNHDGRFTIRSPVGNYRIMASKEGHESKDEEIELRDGAPDLTFVLPWRDDLVSFSGAVVAPQGDPIPEASVSLSAPREGGFWTPIVQLVAEDDGGFDAIVAPRELVLIEAKAPGYETSTTELAMKTDVERVLVLQPLLPFTVTVLDPRGRPVLEVDVIGDAIVSTRWGEERRIVVQKDGSGQPGLLVATQYPFRLYAHALGVGLGLTDVVTIDSYRPQIQLHLSAIGRLRGRAVDSDGAPVKKFDVRIVGVPGADDLMLVKRYFQSPDGSFIMDGVPVGKMKIRVTGRGEGHAEATVDVVAGEPTFLEVVLRRERLRIEG